MQHHTFFRFVPIAVAGLALAGCGSSVATTPGSAVSGNTTSATGRTHTMTPCRYDPSLSAADIDCVPRATVPSLAGKPIDKARAALQGAGFDDVAVVGADGFPSTTDDPSKWKLVSLETATGDPVSFGTSLRTDTSLRMAVAPVKPCEFDNTVPADSTQCAAADPNDHVLYKVTGGSAASITYSAGGLGSVEQATGVGLPWTKKLDVPKGTMSFYYVSAQNAGSGAITCEVVKNGQQVSEHTSTGSYAIVTCSK